MLGTELAARAEDPADGNMSRRYGATVVNPNPMQKHCDALVPEYTEVPSDADALAKVRREPAADAK